MEILLPEITQGLKPICQREFDSCFFMKEVGENNLFKVWEGCSRRAFWRHRYLLEKSTGKLFKQSLNQASKFAVIKSITQG